MKCNLLTVVCALAFASGPLRAGPPQESSAPKLVLQITVDQLRGDLPLRMRDRFGPGGLRLLMEKGAYYDAAHYAHGTTMTAPGHATLFTGANPREHGIVANDWFDPVTGRVTYNCEDMEHAQFGGVAQARAGSSPRNLLCSTIGDELVLASGGRSRVFAVSVKDRGAILPAGRAGKAFWYSKSTGEFVTTDYYYESAPEFLATWNGLKIADSYQGQSWELLAEESTYVFEDDRACEKGYGALGRTFPKPYGEGRGLYAALPSTPAGDQLTLSFALHLMESEGIGQGQSTDFLAISFSSADYVGHFWGPSSREAEDNLLRLDREIARLLAVVDERVGLDNTLVVLSADHGAPDSSDHLMAIGLGAGWVDDAALLKAANRAAKDHFAMDESLIRSHVAPYLYLDHPKIEQLGLDTRAVMAVLQKSIEAQPGMAYVIPRWQLENGELPDNPLFERLLAGFHYGRSGDMWLVPLPQWQLGSGNPRAVLTSLHGTPWAYDTYVPILFMGAGIQARNIHRPVAPRDIAPTIALLLGIKAPNASTGQPLFEVLGD